MIPQLTIVAVNVGIGGVASTPDGVLGVILTANTPANIGLPKIVNSLADAVQQGFTQVAEPAAYRFFNELYSIPGTKNARVYIMLVANTVALKTIVDWTQANYARKLVEFAQGEIRALFVGRIPGVGYTPTTPGFIDSDADEAATPAKVFVQNCWDKVWPLRILLEARVADNSSTTYTHPNVKANNAVGYVLGGTANDGSASLGIVAGRFAATRPRRNIGANEDGAVPFDTLYIGNTEVKNYANRDNMIDWGYITFTNYPQTSGYFISDDPMATDAADDYQPLARCRIIDKAAIITFRTYIRFLKTEVELNPDGTLPEIVVQSLQDTLVNAIEVGMPGEFSNTPQVEIDPTQNIAQTSQLFINLRLTPYGYLKAIEVRVGYAVKTS